MTETLDETTEPVTEPEPVEPPTEPTEPEQPTEPEPEEETAPTEPSGLTQEEREEKKQQVKLMQQAFGTYQRRLKAVMGSDFNDLSTCPLCSDGVPAFLYPPEWITPETDLEARLLDVLRTPSAPEYKEAPNVRQCGTCAGWGSVLSGSRVAGKERVLCPTCKGNGFQGEVIATNPPLPVNGEVVFEPAADAVPLVSEDNDIWGSPKILDDGQENPNYGKMPQYKNPSLP